MGQSSHAVCAVCVCEYEIACEYLDFKSGVKTEMDEHIEQQNAHVVETECQTSSSSGTLPDSLLCNVFVRTTLGTGRVHAAVHECLAHLVVVHVRPADTDALDIDADVTVEERCGTAAMCEVLRSIR